MWIHFLLQNNPPVPQSLDTWPTLCHYLPPSSPWALCPGPLPSPRSCPLTPMPLPWLPGWKTPTSPLIVCPDVSSSVKLPQSLQQLLLLTLLSWITLCLCEELLLLNWALQLQIQYLFPFRRKGLRGRRILWVKIWSGEAEPPLLKCPTFSLESPAPIACPKEKSGVWPAFPLISEVPGKEPGQSAWVSSCVCLTTKIWVQCIPTNTKRSISPALSPNRDGLILRLQNSGNGAHLLVINVKTELSYLWSKSK